MLQVGTVIVFEFVDTVDLLGGYSTGLLVSKLLVFVRYLLLFNKVDEESTIFTSRE